MRAVTGAIGAVWGKVLKPNTRITSSIRSSSSNKSKRQLGGVTVSTPGASAYGKTKRVKTAAHCACVTGMPMTLAARAERNATGLHSGKASTWSSIGPAEPPQMSITNCVMRSMCSTVQAGSTPRSKRCPASVLNA